MAFEEPWMSPEFSTASYSDAWSISEIFNSDETDTIARALQKTFTEDAFYSEVIQIDGFLSAMMPKPTVSGESVAAAKSRRIGGPAPSGRVAKRRYRPSKRALTTFISADPANFRRMVQQVTGTGFAAATAAKPPPHPNGSLAALPTLDASCSYSVEGFSVFSESPATAAKGGGSTAPKFNFDSFCNFPTLESWESDVDLECRGKIGNLC